jgi:hypothetical protein
MNTLGQNNASARTLVDENILSSLLSMSSWVPLPDFQVWEPSTLEKAGSQLITWLNSQSSILASPIDTLANPFPYFDSAGDDFITDHELPESPMPVKDPRPLMLLELSFASESNKSQELVGTGLWQYENIHSTALPQNSWKDCKQKILKMLKDAHRSPLDFLLDLLLDLLDPNINEYKMY